MTAIEKIERMIEEAEKQLRQLEIQPYGRSLFAEQDCCSQIKAFDKCLVILREEQEPASGPFQVGQRVSVMRGAGDCSSQDIGVVLFVGTRQCFVRFGDGVEWIYEFADVKPVEKSDEKAK
ncbi:MAG: hypothetical protein KGL39_05200 [Patescibacteria group bacterium]|nr:hypothetical protein [Patescibacteria group bacterium]